MIDEPITRAQHSTLPFSKWEPYPAYKDSGVEWLGEIPAHWEVLRLKRSCKLITDGSHFSPESQSYGKPYITVKDLNNDSIDFENALKISDDDFFALEKSGCRPNAGDILLSKDGTIGKVVVVNNNNCVILSSLAILRTNWFILNRYLRYFFISKIGIEQMQSRIAGAALRRLTIQIIVNLINLYPPLNEQVAIANFLDRGLAKIDSMVAKKERQIELLQEKRTALISHAVTRGLDPTVKLKPSGIEWMGEIPEQWGLGKLKYNIKQEPGAIKTGPFGSQLLSSEMMDNEFKVYNQQNVINQDVTLGNNYISSTKFNELQAFKVYPGDILLTTRGTIGRCLILPDDSVKGILHPCLMRIQLDTEIMIKQYLIYLIQESGIFQMQLYLLSNATTIDVIYSETIRNIIVPTPPIIEQKSIVSSLQSEIPKINSLIAKIQDGIEILKEYRTALISAAVTGKIDVREEAGHA
jgi:type I restriction enzyme, S subunit